MNEFSSYNMFVGICKKEWKKVKILKCFVYYFSAPNS